MKRQFKKVVALLLVVIMCLTSAPLQELLSLDFPNLFSSKAKASLLQDLGFYEEDYIAGIILNTNSTSCAISADGKSVASMTLDYYTQPQNISLSKCFTDALEDDSKFMSSVAAWEVLTFSPTDIYSETMTKQGYYQTILFDILEVAVDYNIIPTIVKNLNKHVISTLKEINNLEIKVDDIVVNGETSWDLLNSEQQYQIIQTTAGRMTQLEMRNQTLSDFNKLVKTCTTVTDFVEKAAQLTALTTLTEDVKAVIEELYSNSSFIDNMELTASLLELKTAMNNTIDNIGTIGLELLGSAGKLSMDVFLGQMWAECVTALLGSLGAGMLIGQVIGRGLSNILFSTDKVIEKFYTMQALSDFEYLMCKTVKSLGQKYISSQNTTNASNFLKSVDLLYNTYKLDFEYSSEYADIIYTKGLINKVNLFVSGKPDSLEKINSIVNSANASLCQSLGMLTDIDNYCWYLETDYPDVFDIYYNGMSDEDIMNKYVDEVRQLTVACPTDVDIYDIEGNLSVSIKNNCVELCLPGYICIVEDDVKYILLNAGSQSVISITGTATGTMTYTICEGSKAGFNRTMIFKDVALTDGCVYEAVLPEETRLSSDEYVLVSDTGTTIKASYDTQPDFESEVTDVIVAEELFDGFPKEVIDLVADTMFNMKSVVDLSSYDISTDDSIALFSAVSKYYPVEYSLIAGGDFTYKIVVSPSMDRIMKIRFYYGDDANLSTYQKRVNDLNAEIDALVAKIEGMDDFEKALYIHDYIVLNSEYDLELLDYMEKNNFILPGELRSEKYTEYSILVNGTGVCGSYALAYRAILNAAGMECLYLSSSQMNHAWNLVKINGEWYHVDCCWDDPVPDTYGRARRTYFLRTDEEIMKLNHYSWTPGQYKATDTSFSNMPRDYDMRQKYDYGTDMWYSLSGSTLYTCDMSGNNKEELGQFTASSISVDNGTLYYSSGRSIFNYDSESKESKLVYKIPNSKSGARINDARITNVYVKDDTAEYYKYIYDKSGKGSTIYEVGVLSSQSYSAVTGIELNKDSISVDVFNFDRITATILTSGGAVSNVEVDWASSDDTVAFVSNGRITANNVGTATITASIGTFSASCEVTVTGDGLTGSCGDNAIWRFDANSKLLTISGTGSMENYSAFVPWYQYKEKIETATICNGITSIGAYAFSECSSLTSIEIPSSVIGIGNDAFSRCSSLTSIEIPSSVTSIGNDAFAECSSLTNIEIPSSVTSIGERAFCECSSLTSIEIPNGVTSISWAVFSGCSELTSIKIPNSVTSIKGSAFSGCSGLTSIDVPKSVTSIGTYAFSKCSGLTSITMPSSITSIGSWAFSECSGLTSITIPNSITSIEDGTFSRCSSLTSIEIPSSVTSISDFAFYRCSGLTRIEIPNGVEIIDRHAFGECTRLTSIVIPSSVTRMGSKALGDDDHPFIGCSELKSIIVDKDNKAYDSRNNCNAIIETRTNTLVTGCQNTIIPNDVTSIGDHAFYECSGLTSIEIPNGVTSIGKWAFYKCSELTKLEISSSITSIGFSAFDGCSKLESIVVDASNKVYDSRNNCNAIIEINTNTLIIGCKSTVIPGSVTRIGSSAFDGCSGLTSIEIPNSITSIDYSAFSGCSGLTSVEFPRSVTSIGDFVFYGCSGLRCIVISGNVEAMGSSAFDSCTRLEKMLVKNSKTLLVGIPKSTVIYGHENSTAQEYAQNNGNPFVNIDAEPHIHDYFLMGCVESTEENDGYEYYECYCGGSNYRNILHNWGEPVVTEPTCVEDGYKSATCTNCGETEIVETIPATGKHDYQFVSTTPGDCLNEPVYHYTCSVCGDTYDKTGKIDDGHLYKDIVVQPTCTEKGYTKSICEVCGETVISNFVSPLGHNMEITHNGTYCSAHDTLEYKCKRCDYTESVATDSSEFETKTVVVEPTCTKSGSESEVCVLCGATVSTKILNPLSHEYSSDFTVDVEATCTTEGRQSQHCIRCDAKRAITKIEATGHKNISIINAIEATCTSQGYTGDTYCSDCKSIIAKGTSTEMVAHTLMAIVTAPTCTSEGYTTYVCTVCSYSYDGDEMPTIDHSYDDNGICKTCGHSKTENCTCMCHKGGFIGFIWKIIRFFWKLFKMNPVCECGVAHY